jgi:hypothetical protein
MWSGLPDSVFARGAGERCLSVRRDGSTGARKPKAADRDRIEQDWHARRHAHARLKSTVHDRYRNRPPP